MKHCQTCKTEDEEKLHKSSHKNDYQAYRCSECERKRKEKYYATKKGRAVMRAIGKKQYRKHTKKAKARQRFNYALSRGRVIKPENCSKCKSVKKLDAHHPDYKKELEIIWLCRLCHLRLHHGIQKT